MHDRNGSDSRESVCIRALMVLIGACLCGEGCASPADRDADASALSDAGENSDGGTPAMPPGDGGVDASMDAAVDADIVDASHPGLAGCVVDNGGNVVSSGRVVLVPTEIIARYAKKSLAVYGQAGALAATVGDEPLEDAIDELGDTIQSVTLNSDGCYAMPVLPQSGESFFVVYDPAAKDDAHLPGGSASRSAYSRASLEGADLDLKVSGRPAVTATYVGTSVCLSCHKEQEYSDTAHRIGLRTPSGLNALQDGSAFGGIDELAQQFAAGTILYFASCGSSGSDRAYCRVTTEDPGSDVWFEAQLQQVADQLKVTLVNRKGAGQQVFEVALLYGGALGRQQPILISDAPPFGFRVPAPFAWNSNGYVSALDAADMPFIDADSERFYDFVNFQLLPPDKDASFDARCAGCHYVGYQLGGDAIAGFTATAMGDDELDVNADGQLDEINVGCEGCHGPGSQHVKPAAKGARIVSPELLTASRATLVCGACHGRTASRHAAAVMAPLDKDGRMPLPGIRRKEYLQRHTSDSSTLTNDLWPSGDSKAHYQQYEEFIQSGKHRNARVQMACDSCHESHHESGLVHELRRAGNRGCTECHTQAAYQDAPKHVLKATGDPHKANTESDFACPKCHMAMTGLRGARTGGLLDLFPSTVVPVQYYQGDVPSHRFRRYARSEAVQQPTPVNSGCGTCHGLFLDNPAGP